MKFAIQKRLLISFFAFVLLFSFFSLTALAAEYNFTSYIDLTTVSGSDVTFTVKYPVSRATWRFYKGSDPFIHFDGSSFTQTWDTTSKYDVICYPFGGRTNAWNGFSLKNIPNGSSVVVTGNIGFNHGYNTPTVSVYLIYCNSSGTFLRSDRVDLEKGVDLSSLSASFVVNAPEGATNLSVSFAIKGLGNIFEEPLDYTWTLKSFSMQITMPSSSYQSGILDSINDSLNSDSNGAAQDFQDSIANQDQQLDQMAGIMDSIDRPDAGSINVSIDDYVSPSDMQNVSSILSVLFQSDIFLSMLMILLTMSVAAYVLFGKRG